MSSGYLKELNDQYMYIVCIVYFVQPVYGTFYGIERMLCIKSCGIVKLYFAQNCMCLLNQVTTVSVCSLE